MKKKVKGTSCNSSDVDTSMDKSLNRIANTEAGTDILVQGDALTKEAAINSGLGLNNGVTDNAPYKNIAEYKMIPLEDESENNKNIQNSQGS